MPDPITTGPNPQPVEQTQDVATNDQLQAPAQTPAPAQLQLAPAQQPSVTTPPVPPSPNQRLHSFISNTLAGITKSMAGSGPTKYTTDAAGKVVADPNQPIDSRKAQLMRISSNALAGLAAGSKVPQQKSGLASALAGLGAGVEARTDAANRQDETVRKQAAEDYDREQQKIMRMHDIAKGNMHMYTMTQEQRRIEEDRDPHRSQALGWAKAAEDAGVPVQYASLSELNQMRQSNPQILATHQILTIGMKPLTDEEGNPLMDEDGKPKMDAQFAVIDGLHNGSLSSPESFVSDLKKYGKYAGVTGMDNLKPGDDISMQHFVQLAGAITEGKKKELAGWIKPEVVVNEKGEKFERNNNTGELRTAQAIPTSDVKNISEANRKDSTGDITPALRYREDREDARAKMKKDAGNSGPTSDLTGDDYLATLPTGRAAVVKAIGEGRQTLPANRKEALAILEDVHQAYGDWDESLGKTWPKTRNEYMGSGKTATLVVPAYNTALEHMQKLFDNTTSDGIFNPTSKAYQQRQVELGYVTREVGKAVSAGALTQKESEDLLDKLNGGLTPGLRRERVAETAQLLHDKIDEYQNKFNQAAPSPAVHVPLLISPRAASSYDYLKSGGKTQPQTPNQQSNRPVTGQSGMPAGATHIVPGPDGRSHYTNANGTVDYGVAQ